MDRVHESIVNANSVPPFLSKIYDIVDDSSTNSVVSWTTANNSFVVWNVPEFTRDILPKYFKHNNFSSFVRQLNTYGFRKVDPDRWIFANEGFLNGQKHLLKNISRRKPANNAHSQQQPQVQISSVGPCIDKGKSVLSDEVEKLKKDKNSLMQELVSLRQQQQTTDHQLQNVVDRVHVMEQRQQQLMSFLAKAVQSPGFLNQLVQKQSESNRRVTGGNKKRRLPSQDEESLAGQHGPNAFDGQVVRYQPSVNEAAKAVMQQIMQMNVSSRRESWMDNLATFLIGDVPSTSTLGSGNSSSRISGVTLSEVSPNPDRSSVPVEPVPPVSCPSAISSSSSNQIPGMNRGDVSPDFAQMLGNFPGNTVMNPNLMSPEVGDIMNQVSAVSNGTIPVDTDAFSPISDTDISLDEAPKLPAINDSFWEQFLAASPLTSDTCEIDLGFSESGMIKEQELPPGLNVWDNVQQMNHLTEQMGLLVSENGMI